MYPDYDEVFRQTNNLVSDIQQAINGEYGAINCYAQLANLTPNAKVKQQILEIRKDEKKHFRQFVQIYTQLTGKQPQPIITEQCPNTYIKGLEFAIKDEQKTVDFYLDIANSTTDPMIKETFRNAAADEQNHAVWFLYYFTKTR